MEYDYHEAMKLDHQLCFPLYAAARKITGLYTPYLKPLDLTYTQYIVLLVLWEHREITVGELCRRLYLDSGTLTPVLRRLEEKGLITKERSEEDARDLVVTLTQKGEALKKEAVFVPQQVGMCVAGMKDAPQLHRLLHEMMDIFRDSRCGCGNPNK